MNIRFVFLVAMTLQSSYAISLELKPEDIRGKTSKESVSVLQNRYFTKAFRPEFGLMAGIVMDEAYLDTSTFGARAGLFITEWLGFEVQSAKTRVADSADRKALQSKKTIKPSADAKPATNAQGEYIFITSDPEVNAIHSMQDFALVAAPFYGKLNLLNRWIVYTDLYGGAGITRVTTDQGNLNGMTLNVGERFYIGKAWSLRLDIRDRIYKEQRIERQTQKNSYSFDIGASYFFN